MLSQLGSNQSDSSRVVERIADLSRSDMKPGLRQPSLTSQINFAILQTSGSQSLTLKISVQHEGWYRITAAELFAAGLRHDANPQTLQLFVDGHEVPVLLTRGQEKAGSLFSSLPSHIFTLSSLQTVTGSEAHWAI